MNREQARFEFTHGPKTYTGAIWPVELGWVTGYKVTLESEDKNETPDILFSPSASIHRDWEMSCEREDALLFYDKQLLEAIGDQIAVRLLKCAI